MTVFNNGDTPVLFSSSIGSLPDKFEGVLDLMSVSREGEYYYDSSDERMTAEQ